MSVHDWVGMIDELLAFLGLSKWDFGVPRLYPDLPPRKMYTYLSQKEFLRIKALPLVMICPFFSEDDNQSELFYGVALSHLMIRDAMLIRDVAVRVMGDTPVVSYESLVADRSLVRDYKFVVTGRMTGEFSGRFAFVSEKSVIGFDILEETIAGFGESFLRALTDQLDIQLPESLVGDGLGGRPKDAESLLEHGRLWLLSRWKEEDPAEIDKQVRVLRKSDPGFVISLYSMESESFNRRALLRGYQDDPEDSQLCFHIFCALSRGEGEQPSAVQFLRRALELSPAHGKAHMCFPHVANRRFNLLNHSELGYRLLPGNSFAMSNYSSYIQEFGGDIERSLELCYESIYNDPEDPFGYDRLIDLLIRKRDHDKALLYALKWKALYQPMSERTRYCI